MVTCLLRPFLALAPEALYHALHPVISLARPAEEVLNDIDLRMKFERRLNKKSGLTCNALMPIIKALSPIEKRINRVEVEDTVDRLRVSRVRKCFCVRWIDERLPESL
jgi:hypothetical protein